MRSMDEQSKRGLAPWIAVQLGLLCGFQAIGVIVGFVVCQIVFDNRWAMIGWVLTTPVGMVAGIIGALAVGRRLRR